VGKKKNDSAKNLVVSQDGEVLRVRNSERGTLDRCPQQWWWGWREGLKPKETAKPLWFGTGIHLALAEYYQPGKKRSKDMIDLWREFAKEEAEYMRVHVGSIDEHMYVEARDLGEQMLLGYMKEYDGDKHWDVIATEQTFEVRIPWADVFTGSNDLMTAQMSSYLHDNYGDHFLLNGTFDGVYRDKTDGRIKLMEHKTAGSISLGHLPMDNQAGTYWMVAQTVGRAQGWLKDRESIREITYNFLKKSLPDKRPRDKHGYVTNIPKREHYIEALGYGEVAKPPSLALMQQEADEKGIVVLGDRSKVQPPPLFVRHPVKRTQAERRTQLRRLQEEVEYMVLLRDGFVPVRKTPDRNSCSWCPFKDMCELHERGSDWESYRNAMYRSQDPYADHRKSA